MSEADKVTEALDRLIGYSLIFSAGVVSILLYLGL